MNFVPPLPDLGEDRGEGMNRRRMIYSLVGASTTMLAGGYYWTRRWNAIVIHHSAGNYGTIPFLRRVHDERQAKDPIKAIPYHYVIGNGNGLGLGEVAHDWRQDLDLWGAHLSAKNFFRNFTAIGVCLIGNYDVQQVPEQQYASLVQLTKSLMNKFGVAVQDVAGHGYIKGEQTRCPGKNFPMARFLSDISRI